MYLHTRIPLPPPDTAHHTQDPAQGALLSEHQQSPPRQEGNVDYQAMHEAEDREDRLRKADVPSMTDFFHVSRLPNKQRA